MLARYICCPAACLPHAGIIPKRLSAGSRKQRHTMEWLLFVRRIASLLVMAPVLTTCLESPSSRRRRTALSLNYWTKLGCKPTSLRRLSDRHYCWRVTARWFQSSLWLDACCKLVHLCAVTLALMKDIALRRQSWNCSTKMMPRDSSFLTPKISAKFRQRHPQRGRQLAAVATFNGAQNIG